MNDTRSLFSTVLQTPLLADGSDSVRFASVCNIGFSRKSTLPDRRQSQSAREERHAIASIFVDAVSERLETMFLPERY